MTRLETTFSTADNSYAKCVQIFALVPMALEFDIINVLFFSRMKQ